MLNRIDVLLNHSRSPGFCFDRNRYLIDAISLNAPAPFCLKPLSAEFLSSLRSLNLRGVYRLWQGWANLTGKSTLPETSDHICKLLFSYQDAVVKVVIDPTDGRHLHDQSALAWSDVYFKCNYWPSVAYPEKVLPLVNGNGTLTSDKILRLKKLRNHKKEYDLVYWSRIWASPGNELHNQGVEHNIQIFEALAKVEGRKNLLAVFPEEMNDSSLDGYKRRLDGVGVAWQNGWGDVNSKKLWWALATAHINFLRPGNHLCVSWRMMDLLCMGACVVMDGAPMPVWPVPLREGQNFIDSSCALSPNYELPDKKAYLHLTDTVSALIDDRSKIEQIAQNNSKYFDQHASMTSVSDYVLSMVDESRPQAIPAIQVA
jgi:hypothetical protein